MSTLPAQDLRIALVQPVLHWEDAAANLAQLDEHLDKLTDQPDLVVLPETFTTGFTMEPAPVAEPPAGPTLAWMRRRAAGLGAVITGSFVVVEEGKFYNRLHWVRPDGSYATYDKRHRFAMAGEDRHYAGGRERLIVTLKGWRVCPLICYDLRFPVWSRNDEAYDLLLYVANWPTPRSAHWRTLLAARAIENQAYVAAVNRVGTDENGYDYRGDSRLIDPGTGEPVLDLGTEAGMGTAVLSHERLAEVRTRLPFLRDRDAFRLLP